MTPSPRFSRTLLAAGTAAVLLALAGCSSTASSAPTSTAAAAASDADGKQAAIDFVAASASPAVFTSPGDAIDIAAAKGGTVAAITLDNSLPFVRAVLDGMAEAADAAGVELQIYDAKGSTDTAAKEVSQAIAAKSSAIVAFGINFNLLPNAITEANDAGIPVIGALNIDSNAELETGAAGEVSIDYRKSGKLLAAYAIANTDGPVHAALQNLPSIETFTAMRQGVEDGFAEFCPEACTLQIDDMTQADFKTATETLTGTELARIDGLNWIFPAIDGIALNTIPAIELAGVEDTVRVGSINAVTANLEYIVDGRVQAVDVGNNNNWLGWAMLDRTLRAIGGADPAMSEVPVKLFDAENLAGVDVTSEAALFDDVDYKTEYAALWK